MAHWMLAKKLLTALVLVVIAVATHALTLQVNCGGMSGLSSVGAALKILQNEEFSGPDTIKVSGACKENVTISGFNRLTLLAAPGASISDASGGTTEVLAILDSSTVHVEGLTLNGSVSCFEGSHCVFVANTFQGSPGNGLSVARSYTDLLADSAGHGNVIQNSVGAGLDALSGAVVRTFELKIRNSGGAGAVAELGSNLTAGNSSFVNNGGAGIRLVDHSTLRIFESSVRDNAGNGILVLSASEARIENLGLGNSINDNAGAGVSIGDLSFVWFVGVSNVTGNRGGTDVVCNPQFSATRGALVNIGGGTTNCVEP